MIFFEFTFKLKINNMNEYPVVNFTVLNTSRWWTVSSSWVLPFIRTGAANRNFEEDSHLAELQ